MDNVTKEKALVFIVHGSRREESNAAMVSLTQKLKKELSTEYNEIRLAYLELCDPRIGPVVQGLAENGCRNIDLFPYFLAPGNHVKEDIPKIVSQLRQAHPQSNISTLSFLGDTRSWAHLVANSIRDAQITTFQE